MKNKEFNKVAPKADPVASVEKLYGYHVHLYVDGTDETEKKAKRALLQLEEQFPDVLKDVHRLGRNVGPHLSPNYSSFIEPEDFGKIVGWLQLHSEGLSILIHPITDDEMRDHRDCTMWIGTPEPLNLSFFEPGKPAPPKGPALQ